MIDEETKGREIEVVEWLDMSIPTEPSVNGEQVKTALWRVNRILGR